MRNNGYSLFELVVTLAVAAIVIVLGLPSFASLMADNRLRTETNAIFHAVHLARKESVVRRRAVSICPTLDGRNCSKGVDWSTGWIMFVNADRDDPPQIDSGEPILASHEVIANIKVVANRRGFTLRSTELRATNGTILFCDPRKRTAARALVISYTGRPRISRKDSRNQPYDCGD